MRFFKRKQKPTITVEILPSKPTFFEERLGYQENRKIASSQVDGGGMRLSAFAQQKLILWQLEDADGNKMAGVWVDLESAMEIIKGQLDDKDFQ